MQHFIWVFTVCQSTHLGVSGLQRVKLEKKSVQLFIFTVGKTRIEQFPLDLEVIAGYDAKFTCSGSTDFDEAKNMVVSVFPG